MGFDTSSDINGNPCTPGWDTGCISPGVPDLPGVHVSAADLVWPSFAPAGSGSQTNYVPIALGVIAIVLLVAVAS